MKKLIEKCLSNQIIRFGLVGGASTAIDFIVYMLLSWKLDISISKAVSMIVASLFSYFINKKFTFKNEDRTSVGYLVRYYLVFGANLMVNLGINQFVYDVTENKILAFICATLGGMTVNYLGQRFFVFFRKQ